jgi:hypothetical protein
MLNVSKKTIHDRKIQKPQKCLDRSRKKYLRLRNTAYKMYRKTNLLIVVVGAQHFAHGSRGLHNPVAVDGRQLLGEAQLDFLTNSREGVPFPSTNRDPARRNVIL